MIYDNKFHTPDTETASILKYHDIPFSVSVQGKQVIFSFDEAEKCESLIDLYNNSQLPVDAQKLFAEYRFIKKTVMEALRK